MYNNIVNTYKRGLPWTPDGNPRHGLREGNSLHVTDLTDLQQVNPLEAIDNHGIELYESVLAFPSLALITS